MRELYEFASEIQLFCEKQRWSFCFIGGIAVQHWGEPRLTKDVDMTLLAGFGKEAEFVDKLLTRFRGRIDDARNFALERRVLLMSSDEGIGIDVALGGLPFEKSAVERALMVEFLPGLALRVCTPEDLIVFKSFAARPIDWQDVKMTIARQDEANLDWAYILHHLEPLVALKEQPEILKQLKELRSGLHRKGGTPKPNRTSKAASSGGTKKKRE